LEFGFWSISEAAGKQTSTLDIKDVKKSDFIILFASAIHTLTTVSPAPETWQQCAKRCIWAKQ
jgi:hypothetical protein